MLNPFCNKRVLKFTICVEWGRVEAEGGGEGPDSDILVINTGNPNQIISSLERDPRNRKSLKLPVLFIAGARPAEKVKTIFYRP